MYLHLMTEFYSDTLFCPRQNTCAQVYSTIFHWYLLRKESKAHFSLDQLHRDICVCKTIFPNNAIEFTNSQFCNTSIHAESVIRPVKAYSHNHNIAESSILELWQVYRNVMKSFMAEILSNSTLDILELDGDTPLTQIKGDTADISQLCEF
jgi:hypothetical protein